jgi:F-type H+-transporting ATPase subunit delta
MSAVGNSYAKALYEAARDVDRSPDALNKVEKDLERMVFAVDSSREAKAAFLGPIATKKEKEALIREISKALGFSKITEQFMLLLASRGRLPLIREIRDAFASVRLVSEGGLLGKLVSAEEIGQADVESLSQAFAKKLGKRVAFRVSTDPSLLAGMKVTVNGVTYDGTLRSQLQQLRDQVLQGLAGAGTVH